MNNEVINLVEHAAKKILDGLLNDPKRSLKVDMTFEAAEMFAAMKQGTTRKIIFSNLEEFDTRLNAMVFSRLDYLVEEGFLICENGIVRSRNQEEMEEFLLV